MRTLVSFLCLLAFPVHAFNLNRQISQPQRLAALAAVDSKAKNAPVDGDWTSTTRRAFGHRSFALAASVVVAVAPMNGGVQAVAPTEAEVAAAAKARNDEVKARLAAKAADDAAFRDAMQTTPRGLKFGTITAPTDLSSPTPVRGQSLRVEYTLSVNGFKGEAGAIVVDDSRGFMKPPFALYAGVGSQLLGKPFKALDLALMDMRAGEIRRVVALPSLAFGATAIGRSIPENADMFLEVTLVELGAEPIIDEEQEQWLRQNPL